MSTSTLSNKPDNVDLFVLEPGLKKVSCEINEKADCNKFIIRLEDHTIGNLLKHQLSRDPYITFSAYRMPHPLINTIEITIKPKGYAGVKLFASNVNRLINQVEKLKENFHDKTKQIKEKGEYYDMFN